MKRKKRRKLTFLRNNLFHSSCHCLDITVKASADSSRGFKNRYFAPKANNPAPTALPKPIKILSRITINAVINIQI